MRIIFDSEEQKERFISLISPFLCPSDIGIGNDDADHCSRNGACRDCWKNCGIEIEVKESEG